MANVVGFAAIAVTAVLVPLGALQILPPVAPGLATEQAAAPSESERQSASDPGSRVIFVPARGRDEAGDETGDETVVLSASAPAPAVADSGSGSGSDAAGNGGGSQGGGGQGGGAGTGAGQGGVAGGGGDVGVAGTVVEANEDAIIVGQESPTPPSPGPVPPPPVVTDEGTPGEGGASPHESGHDKCKGQGHQHHEHDDCQA
jgi:hypothetical protein